MSQILNSNMRLPLCSIAAFEKFRDLIVPLLISIFVAIVGDTTWELILHTFALIRFQFMHLIDAQVLHTLFESRFKRGKKSLQRGLWRASHA